jgi:hypothetical protein
MASVLHFVSVFALSHSLSNYRGFQDRDDNMKDTKTIPNNKVSSGWTICLTLDCSSETSPRTRTEMMTSQTTPVTPHTHLSQPPVLLSI